MHARANTALVVRLSELRAVALRGVTQSRCADSIGLDLSEVGEVVEDSCVRMNPELIDGQGHLRVPRDIEYVCV